jgi:hypothetical protein
MCFKLNLSSNKLCIITIYRALARNIDTFITKLDTILEKLYIPAEEYIICGDININYLLNNEVKCKLDALLRTYNVMSTVNFPTRIQGNSATAIDNVSIDMTIRDEYYIIQVTGLL